MERVFLQGEGREEELIDQHIMQYFDHPFLYTAISAETLIIIEFLPPPIDHTVIKITFVDSTRFCRQSSYLIATTSQNEPLGLLLVTNIGNIFSLHPLLYLCTSQSATAPIYL